MITREELIDRLEEACSVWRRMPDKERRFLFAGKTGSWPTIVLSYYEAYGMAAPKMRLPPPSSDAIDRAEEVLEWLSWLGGVYGRLTMKCVWMAHGEQKQISTICKIVGLHRNNVRKKREFGLQALMLHVNRRKHAA